MSRKGIRVLTIVLMLILSFLTIANSAFAAVNLDIGTGLLNNGNVDSSITNPTSTIIATAISTVQIVGIGIAIIMLVMIAIKYMTAAPSDKADFKKSATAYIVGAIVLFAASGILGIVKNFVSNSINNTNQLT